MTDKPTGVFVRLPLSDEQRELMVDAAALGQPDDSHDKAIIAIGTPVQGGELETLGYVPEGPLWNGAKFGMRNLYRTTEGEVWPRAVTGLVEAQAQIAARDAEIVRLREALTVKSDLHMDAALSAFHHMRGYSDLEKVRAAVKAYCDALKGGAA